VRTTPGYRSTSANPVTAPPLLPNTSAGPPAAASISRRA
jgi:hypothetical protein